MSRLLEILCAAMIIALAGAVMLPLWTGKRTHCGMMQVCLSHTKRMGMALAMYNSDNDDHLPDKVHWVDSLAPYDKDRSIFDDTGVVAKYGYAFDSRLSLKSSSSFADPRSQTAIYDSANLKKNASDPFTSLPKPGRHNGANNIGYLDGHAKAVVQK